MDGSTETIQAHEPATQADTTVIPDRLFYRIRDVSSLLGVKPYVLRYWETEFPILSPQKSPTGHRVYKKNDVETLMLIKHLLYTERYSIEGARKRIKELKKDGELKNFAEKVVQSPGSIEVISSLNASGEADSSEEVAFGAQSAIEPALPKKLPTGFREAVDGLAELAARPMGELFRY